MASEVENAYIAGPGRLVTRQRIPWPSAAMHMRRVAAACRTKLACLPLGRPISWKPMAGMGRRLGAGSWIPQRLPLSRG